MTRTGLRAQVQFAMVPVWVLERCSSRAVHVYGWLMKHANRDRRAWPRTEVLADMMGMAQRSVERAIAELRREGALQTSRRHAKNGAVLGLEFVLIQVDPNEDLPATGGGKGSSNHPATSGGKVLPHPATGVGDIPPPVSGRLGPDPYRDLDPCEPEVKAGAAPRHPVENPLDNVGVLTKLVHQILDFIQPDPVDLPELVKESAASYAIAYNTEAVTLAIESADFQRVRAGKNPSDPNSAGATKARRSRAEAS